MAALGPLRIDEAAIIMQVIFNPQEVKTGEKKKCEKNGVINGETG